MSYLGFVFLHVEQCLHGNHCLYVFIGPMQHARELYCCHLTIPLWRAVEANRIPSISKHGLLEVYGVSQCADPTDLDLDLITVL